MIYDGAQCEAVIQRELHLLPFSAIKYHYNHLLRSKIEYFLCWVLVVGIVVVLVKLN